MKKLQDTSYGLKMFGICGLVIGVCLVISASALVLIPSELGEVQTTVSVIKPLPANYNPYQRLYDEMLYPTVRISTPTGVGSGVIIHRRGAEDAEKYNYILTANHVVGNNTSVTVTIYTPLNPLLIEGTGGEKSPLERGRGVLSLNASVVMTDTNKDLALLQIRNSNSEIRNWKTAKLAPKNYTPFLFTPVYAVGCSLGLNPRPSFGHITAIVSHQDTKTPSNSLCLSALVASHWEISAPILPGNSGGPVFNANTHEVIGIAVWVRTYQGQLITTMAGVVPIIEIHKFLDLATKALRQSEASRQRD